VALHGEQDRVVEVECDVASQRHVPAFASIRDARGLVGRIKVEREANGKDAGEPERHVGVAREVKIKLHGVDDQSSPGIAAESEPALREATSAVEASLSAISTFFWRDHENQVAPSETSSGLKTKRRTGRVSG